MTKTIIDQSPSLSNIENQNENKVILDQEKAKEIANKLEKQGVHFQEIVDDAREGAKLQDVDLGVIKAFKIHWKAALWSMAISTCLIMEGYDLVIVTSFYGQTDFLNRFGTIIPGSNPPQKEITAPWESGISNSALCGEIIGLAINGWASERFGYRKTLMSALFLMGCSIFVPVFMTSLPVLSFGEVLQGIPWGIFQTVTTAFAVEICPQTLRHYLTTYVCFCWGFGIFLSSVVVRATLSLGGSEWSWRLPFALQWVWPIPLFLVAFFAPESPWWLIRKGKNQEARESIKRLSPKNFYNDRDLDRQTALMIHTTALESIETKGSNYLDCFKGINLRRTTISCMTWAMQWLCGNPLMSFAVVFYQKAGLSEIWSYNFTIIMNTTYMIGTIASWKIMDHAGRRSIYLMGGLLCCMILCIIGGLGFGKGQNIQWAIGSFLIIFALTYNCTIGPVCYAIVSEIPSGKLRAKTIVLARMTYNLTGLITNTITPRMISATEWNWGARGALLYLGTCAIMTIYFYFCLPETRNRSFGDLDLLFQNKVNSRKFAKSKVDQFQSPIAIGTIHQSISIIHLKNVDENKNVDDNQSIDEKKSLNTLHTTVTSEE